MFAVRKDRDEREWRKGSSRVLQILVIGVLRDGVK